MEMTRITYDDDISRKFIAASVVFGLVGMLVGVLIALQLAFWPANMGEYLSFGRLRPLHTNAVIFAFVGNMLFAGVYYSTQRLLKVRLASDLLSRIHFWGWQAIIVAAAITLPLGITQGKEYAELEWPIDVAIAVVWLVFAANFFLTLKNRNEKHLYVALWFYIATIVTITVLHVVNSLAMPVFALKSYSAFGGVQDALVQWWYGHNAVAFFLTTPILGIMYYFLPKAAERPVFSYRLSIIHFWSLVFLYIWAGPHHLLNTALPDWAQSLGMIFSLMLIAPSWGGMLNGLLTLRGAWDKLRVDPVLKFFAAGVTFYGMATFEGPMMSIKAVNSLAHYTDWIIGHVHSGALGWNGFMAAGMFYWMVPRLFGTKLHSRAAANFHFYIGTFGILLYVISMWVAGITQGLMWRAENETGGLLYPNFVETLIAIRAMYWMRLIGGTLYLLGFVIQAWNLWKTARAGAPVDGTVEVPARVEAPREPAAAGLVLGRPVVLCALGIGVLLSTALMDEVQTTIVFALVILVGIIVAVVMYGQEAREARAERGEEPTGPTWHRLVEGRALPFTALTILAVLVGGIAEIVPSVVAGGETLRTTSNVPYTALELEGRDVYLKEGCYNCHSQMIRPFTWETARYGEVSSEHDSVFDHPFQWGSKRTGPDLARVGGRYSNLWHYKHMLDPREISPGSNMPPYQHLEENLIELGDTPAKMRAMVTVGVPYSGEQLAGAEADALAAGTAIAAELKEQGGIEIAANSELVALISYLQRLGKTPAPPAEDAPGGDAPAEVSQAVEKGDR
ncbi:MAG: cytochrome-c oxidase, cbb3-type subunit I [Myxococcales bacterium]|nr:cytochrome-c oxidase, cbb3-type subunit I [Myxococcales bacterium]